MEKQLSMFDYYTAGYDAAYRGDITNPYDTGTPEHMEWECGANDCMNDAFTPPDEDD